MTSISFVRNFQNLLYLLYLCPHSAVSITKMYFSFLKEINSQLSRYASLIYEKYLLSFVYLLAFIYTDKFLFNL